MKELFSKVRILRRLEDKLTQAENMADHMNNAVCPDFEFTSFDPAKRVKAMKAVGITMEEVREVCKAWTLKEEPFLQPWQMSQANELAYTYEISNYEGGI